MSKADKNIASSRLLKRLNVAGDHCNIVGVSVEDAVANGFTRIDDNTVCAPCPRGTGSHTFKRNSVYGYWARAGGIPATSKAPVGGLAEATRIALARMHKGQQ